MQQQSPGRTSYKDWCVVVLALVLPTFVTLAYFVWAAESAAGAQQATYSIAKVIQFALPVVWVCWIQRDRLHLWPWNTQGLLLGIVFGLVVAIAMVALYHTWLKSADFFIAGTNPMKEKISEIGLGQPWKFVALGVFYSLCHSFLEEYYWRWFVFGQLKRLTRFWPAVIVSSLGFMAHHVLVVGTYFGYQSPITWLFSLAIAIGGGFWAWLYDRSGSLLGPWAGHLLVDVAIIVVGYDIVSKMLGG